MSGMGTPGGATAGTPVLALVLALFMLGYILRTTDGLAFLSRARAPRHRGGAPSRLSVAAPAPATQPPPSHSTAADASPAGRPSLAPRLAVGYKIAMGLGMGYMLVTMF